MQPGGGSGESDLSGAWSGLYTFPRAQPPVFFEAVLVEATSWLTGTITEEVEIEGHRRMLEAVVQGRRSGSSVTWLKIYDGGLRAYDAVHYEGRVNAEATEIEGKWRIPGNWSGGFLMIRAGGRQAVRSRAIFQDA